MVASRIVLYIYIYIYIYISCVSFVVRKVDAAERTLDRG